MYAVERPHFAATTMGDVGDGDGDANLFEHLKSHVVRVAERVARSHDKSLTPKTAHALSELSYELTKSIARDVRAYANHADRDVVGVKDCDLRARRLRQLVERRRRAMDEDGDE